MALDLVIGSGTVNGLDDSVGGPGNPWNNIQDGLSSLIKSTANAAAGSISEAIPRWVNSAIDSATNQKTSQTLLQPTGPSAELTGNYTPIIDASGSDLKVNIGGKIFTFSKTLLWVVASVGVGFYLLRRM